MVIQIRQSRYNYAAIIIIESRSSGVCTVLAQQGFAYDMYNTDTCTYSEKSLPVCLCVKFAALLHCLECLKLKILVAYSIKL